MSKFCTKCGYKLTKLGSDKFDPPRFSSKTGKPYYIDKCSNSNCEDSICPITGNFHKLHFSLNPFAKDKCKCGVILSIPYGFW
jgi:hypothetical protein